MTIQNRNDEIINYDHGSRIARLEATIENINQSLNEIKSKLEKIDSRLWNNFYWMIAGFTGILAVIAHGFKWY